MFFRHFPLVLRQAAATSHHLYYFTLSRTEPVYNKPLKYYAAVMMIIFSSLEILRNTKKRFTKKHPDIFLRKMIKAACCNVVQFCFVLSE